MRLFLSALLIVIPIHRASAQLPDSTPVFSDRSILQYDDGTAEWTSMADYKGVWFSLSDFSPYAIDFYCDQLEFWMHYSMGSGWWDSEIWIGGPEGPESLLISVETAGISMQPTFVDFDPPIQCGDNFWVVADCMPMGSGRPYFFADGSPNPVSHSFVSSDWEIWEPFIPGSSSTAVDFFIRAHGTLQLNLEESSWGAVKTLFY